MADTRSVRGRETPTAGRRYVRVGAAARHIAVSPSTFRRLVERGVLPPGIRLSAGTVLWDLDAIEQAIAKRAGGR